jgi:hypothetical protein
MNVHDALEKAKSTTKDYRQIKVVIGGDGKTYQTSNAHFEVSEIAENFSQVVFLLPDSVAEYFRQEGRRQLQAEMRGLLNVSRA